MEKRTIQNLEAYAALSRKMATEGMVLLKNDDKMLPITENESVAVFGRAQIDTYRSGTGSGGSVNVPYKVSVLQGLRNQTAMKYDEDVSQAFEAFVDENPFDNGGGGWASEPWFQKDMPLREDFVKEAAKRNQKAIYIIGRTAGEDQDNREVPGGYLLTETELGNLEMLCRSFEDVAVLLNVANVVDMSWIDNLEGNTAIKALMYVWQGGMEGGNAIVDVISGQVNPSGKLTDTIARHIFDYPSHNNFGDDHANIYQEDIYVGYRYFETFDKKAVLYPFGYGLSYTTFSHQIMASRVVGTGIEALIEVDVQVTNTGDTYAGKEVIQLYYSAPQGALGKPAKELGAFIKTDAIKPGASEIVSLIMPVTMMASYDDSGVTGVKSAYVLEAGAYVFYVGNSIDDPQEVILDAIGSYEISQLMVVEQLEEAMAPTMKFDRVKPGSILENGLYERSAEPVPTKTVDTAKRITDRQPTPVSLTGNLGYKLADVASGKVDMQTFIGQLSAEDLMVMVRGEGMSSPKVTPGTAGAFGGVGDNLLKLGIPVACAADGPSGIRMDSGDLAVQVPIGTLIACSWNLELAEELYGYMSGELVDNQVDTLLGPGMNIHRHPLNGRNFEYFSEDPLLTGKMAAAITRGLNKKGVYGTIKHFAANDQEHRRNDVDSIVSERALREIHLKGFEIAVKEGSVRSIMTAYNPINGIWTASNYDLNTTILRGEWGYKGFIMTDWWAKMNDPVTGGQASRTNLRDMVRSQNDVYMLVNNFGAEVNSLSDNLMEAFDEGTLTLAELQRCAINICDFIIHAPVIERPIHVAVSEKFDALATGEFDQVQNVQAPITVDSKVNKVLYFEVDESGEYSISLHMRNENGFVAQSACNLLLNDQYVANVQLNGTGDYWVKIKSVNVQLTQGIYKLGLDFTKPGLEIKSINLTPLNQ